MTQIRQIAYKVWISDLLNGDYKKNEGEWEPNFVTVRGRDISRVNLIVNIVNKFMHENGTYLSFDLDDGSGIIRAKTWREDADFFKYINVGDLILIIGRPRKYNEEIYLVPEIMKVLDNVLWAKVRKLDLENEYGKPTSLKEPISNTNEFQEGDINQNDRKKILNIISKQEEISYDLLIKTAGMDEKRVESTIKELIKEGEIYTPRPNMLKVI